MISSTKGKRMKDALCHKKGIIFPNLAARSDPIHSNVTNWRPSTVDTKS
jgi:hypothetical protein